MDHKENDILFIVKIIRFNVKMNFKLARATNKHCKHVRLVDNLKIIESSWEKFETDILLWAVVFETVHKTYLLCDNIDAVYFYIALGLR